MVSKSMSRMKAINSPDWPATSRDIERRQHVQSLRNLEESMPTNYIHVHQFKTTKLYGAWFNDPTKAGKKVRIFFGSHLTAYLAARAQDRAALKYKPFALNPQSIKLNFKEEDYVADQELRNMLTCEEFAELLRKESRPKYTKMEPTLCLSKFLDHERSCGNIPPTASSKEGKRISLRNYLEEVVRKRKKNNEDTEDTDSADGESGDDRESYEETCSEEEGTEGPFPTANQERQASKMDRAKQSEGKRGAVLRYVPVVAPSEMRSLVLAPLRLVWGRTRRRTKRHDSRDKNLSKEEVEYPQGPARNKLQYKLHKIQVSKS